MIIRITNDLKKEEIWANGNELAGIMGCDRENGRRVLSYPMERKIRVHTFSHPVLLTDNYRTSRLQSGLRDTLFSLYGSRPRIVEYDNVRILWDQRYPSVWCPSIDTVLFAKALSKILKERKDLRSAAEIGCGSGFLSKYALMKSRPIKSMLINDLNPEAIHCAMANIKDKRAIFYAGNGLDKIKGMKFDLLICNPPYVPRPNSIDDNPYEGIEMLNHLLHHGQDYLNPEGILLTNVSSLCWKIVLRDNPKMKMRILEKMSVPLKVNNIINSREWLRYLEKIGLKKKFKRGYEYWQDINIISLGNI